MSLSALGHPLATLNEGATAVIDGAPHSVPLEETRFHVDVHNGLATITATRVLMNNEDKPIEVLLTMPAPFEAVMTGLSAIVDGRRLYAIAQGRETARATYEDATDRGKLAVLHEEPMRGIHMLSVSQLAPGRKVEVVAEMVLPLVLQGDRPFLRLPLTVGEINGHSPFLPADDIAVDPNLRLEGHRRRTAHVQDQLGENAGATADIEPARTCGRSRPRRKTWPRARLHRPMNCS